ncbi:MAG: hypothetical protein WB497_19500, partial [Pseudolabrys sp.]
MKNRRSLFVKWTRPRTLQYNQLLSQRGILCFKSALGLEERGNQVQEEKYQRDHRGRRYAILSPDQYRMKFSAHTGPPGSAV